MPRIEAGADAMRQLFQPLEPELRPAVDLKVEHGIAELLLVLGPLLGVFVLLFGARDAWIDPAHGTTALRIRVTMVLLAPWPTGKTACAGVPPAAAPDGTPPKPARSSPAPPCRKRAAAAVFPKG
jgi:hypothetical protein